MVEFIGSGVKSAAMSTAVGCIGTGARRSFDRRQYWLMTVVNVTN